MHSDSSLEQRTYYYNRSENITKYSWTQAEIEAEQRRHAQQKSVANEVIPRNNEDENQESPPVMEQQAVRRS